MTRFFKYRQYTAINNTEQRRSYKAEFNSDYEEYRRLHTQIADVSKRFADLEEQRQRELEVGNAVKGLVIIKIIMINNNINYNK